MDNKSSNKYNNELNFDCIIRYGIAQEKLGDFDAAKSYLLRAKNICPNDPSIARALSNVSLNFFCSILMNCNSLFSL